MLLYSLLFTSRYLCFTQSQQEDPDIVSPAREFAVTAQQNFSSFASISSFAIFKPSSFTQKGREELQAFSLPAVPSFRQWPVRVRSLLIRILLLYPHRVFSRTKIIYPTGVYLSRENYFIFIKCQSLQHDRQANTFTAALRNYKERPACRHHFATRQTEASVFHTPVGTVYPATLYPATDTDMLPVRQCRRLR